MRSLRSVNSTTSFYFAIRVGASLLAASPLAQAGVAEAPDQRVLAPCQRLPEAEQWLARASKQWRKQLQAEAGYEPLPGVPQVCALQYGNPFADQVGLRMHVRGWRTENEHLTLAHEYVHLVLRNHPRGRDEYVVEQLARRLTGGGE